MLFNLDIPNAWDLEFFPIILSFVFVAIFDTAGTLIGLGEQGHFLDEKGFFLRPKRTLVNDAMGTTVGATLGTSMLTNYLESAAGIAAGGRTGLTAVTVSFLFLISLFFAPFATSIPHFATAPALIIIGALMVQKVGHIDWEDPSEYIPAFAILITIPLTFSISTGIAMGFITYPFIKLFSGKGKEVNWMVWVIALLFALKFEYA